MSSEKATIANSSSQTFDDDPSTDLHIELLTEHFGFNPRVFIDALVYVANEHLYSIGSQFEKFVRDQLRKQYSKNGGESSSARKTNVSADLQAEKGVHAILTLLENALDHTFDVLELYCLKAVFGIKPSQARFITLSHHKGLDLRSAKDKIESGSTTYSISSQEESIDLEKRQAQLLAQIRKAKKIRHALTLASVSAKKNLEKAQHLNRKFSTLFTRQDGTPQLPIILPQSARKLTLDASSLLKSMDTLIKMDPLGADMLSTPEVDPDEFQRKKIMSESGVSEEEQKSWKGREGYIHWETNRIMNSVRQRRLSDVGNLSTRSISAVKRRKTEDQESNPEAMGGTNELEELADLLQR